MKHFPIATKILTIVAVFAIFVVGVTLFATGKMRGINDAYADLSSHQNVATVLLTRGSREMMGMKASVGDLLMSNTDEGNASAMKSIAAQRGDFVSNLDEVIALLPGQAAKYTALKQRGLQAVDQICGHAVDLGGKATATEAVLQSQAVYAKECAPAIVDAVNTFHAAVDDLLRDTRSINEATMEMTSTTIQLTWALILGGLVVVVGTGFFATRSWISKPLTRLVSSMSAVAGGDYQVVVAGEDRRDEIGAMARVAQVFKATGSAKRELELRAAAQQQAEEERRQREAEVAARLAEEQAQVVTGLGLGLAHLAEGNLAFRLDTAFATSYEKLRQDFNAAMDKLHEAIRVVATSTTAIRSGSTEISAAADDLSRRTERQAASLEETAAALDQITATVKKTSEGAHHARSRVSTAKSDAERSGEVVTQAVAAMTAIAKSSQQVSQIIGVIDEIAFQTNLLALNAGVEAARAGDAGRGFAVVASEVRALAQRSAEAAKEIKALISASGQQVSDGVHLVDATGKSLDRIVTHVAEIDTIVSEIASSALEEASGLAQVNIAINQMDQVTQQNAAMVEQSTAASHGLASKTEELAQLVGRFSLESEVARSGALAPPATVTVLKSTGRSGVVRKVALAPAEAGWEDF